MPGKTIGLSLNNGWAGTYARQPDMLLDTHPLGGSDNVYFGLPLAYDDEGNVIVFGATHTSADFAGVAAKEIKSAVSYESPDEGSQYRPGEAVSVFKRGSISVICNVGTPKMGGKVYIRVAKNTGIPTGSINGFEAQADGTNTVEIPCCEWYTGADTNKVAELVLKTRNRA